MTDQAQGPRHRPQVEAAARHQAPGRFDGEDAAAPYIVADFGLISRKGPLVVAAGRGELARQDVRDVPRPRRS
ncbi:hypothetical protein GCM10012289_56950 [Nonomuraea cavernae]|uniref:Uncharacterized protein n=1 Tax=Nonomuraea cavernae TaxID=2045107 RepID=A0A917Z7P7_9ACTN|nr:hypothetical protein GCM10012289_56950 [Nonomuraea cavernae]